MSLSQYFTPKMPGRDSWFTAIHQYVLDILHKSIAMETVRDPQTGSPSSWSGEDEIFPKKARSIEDVMTILVTKLDTGGS